MYIKNGLYENKEIIKYLKQIGIIKLLLNVINIVSNLLTNFKYLLDFKDYI